MKNIISIITVLLIMTSCGGPKNATLVKKSADGKTTVTITGKKESVGPFNTTMTVKSGDIPEGSLIFEIYADDLNDKNIRFDWSDAQHAVITFTQMDGEKKVFNLSVSETNVILAPVL